MSNHSGDANKMVGENHIRDATKMVSDTPRTDAAYFEHGATMYDLAGEMKRVERELNAANEKIEVLLISDCERLRIENELNAANERIKRLEGELESTKLDRDSWSDQSDEFAKTAADLIIHIKRLEEVGDAMADVLVWSSGIQYKRSPTASAWRKAKEAKP